MKLILLFISGIGLVPRKINVNSLYLELEKDTHIRKDNILIKRNENIKSYSSNPSSILVHDTCLFNTLLKMVLHYYLYFVVLSKI